MHRVVTCRLPAVYLVLPQTAKVNRGLTAGLTVRVRLKVSGLPRSWFCPPGPGVESRSFRLGEPRRGLVPFLKKSLILPPPSHPCPPLPPTPSPWRPLAPVGARECRKPLKTVKRAVIKLMGRIQSASTKNHHYGACDVCFWSLALGCLDSIARFGRPRGFEGCFATLPCHSQSEILCDRTEVARLRRGEV